MVWSAPGACPWVAPQDKPKANPPQMEFPHYPERIDKTLYYTAGAKAAEGEMKNGRREGRWIFYYPDGKRRAIGSRTTPSTACGIVHPNTEVPSRRGLWVDGKKTGLWTRWHVLGQKIEEGE